MPGNIDVVVELRNKLCKLGYDARIANISCFDIHQNGWWHYLSFAEAEYLSTAVGPHPLTIRDYGEQRGLNYWYNFPQV